MYILDIISMTYPIKKRNLTREKEELFELLGKYLVGKRRRFHGKMVTVVDYSRKYITVKTDDGELLKITTIGELKRII